MARKPKFDFDLIVIGSGAAGAPAAEIVARAGKRVAIIENGDLGGSATSATDIPLASLMEAAHAFDDARRTSEFGMRTNTLGYNFPSILAWKDAAIERASVGTTVSHYRNLKISVFKGMAQFISANEITVERRKLTAEYILIATGAHAVTPGIPGLSDIDYLTPETAMNQARLPKSLFVIGAGATGTELAEFYAIFGSKVYLSDMASRILPREDEEASALATGIFRTRRDVEILSGTRVIEITKEGALTTVTYVRGGNEYKVKVERVLLATGFAPNLDLELASAGVTFDEMGIQVNEWLMTTAKNIFAAGDVLGENARTNFGAGYTSSALFHAQIVANNILKRAKKRADDQPFPRLTNLSPQIASIGLSEKDCLRRDIKIKKAIVPINVTTRATTTNKRDGFVKVIVDSRGVIIGATIAAPQASETIHELAIAIRAGLTATDIVEAVHVFGSWAEAIRVACTKLI